MSNEIITPLEMSARIADVINSVNNDTLSEYTAPTRLSPVVLLDQSVMTVDQGLLGGLMQTILSIYTGQYLSAINISMNVGDINVLRLLNQFSTERDLVTSAGNSRWLSFVGNNSLTPTLNLPEIGQAGFLEDLFGKTKGGQSAKPDLDKTIIQLKEDSNLAVGKVIEVKILAGDGLYVTIPVTATLKPKVINSDDLITLTSYGNTDRTAKGRYHQWRASEITFIKDYLLDLDLIEQDRKSLIADKTGHLLRSRSDRTNGVINALLSGYASPNAVSSVIIISKSTAAGIEAILGKLAKTRNVEKFFSINSVMMLVVVDTAMERFTLYQKGVSESGQYTLDDISINNKKANGVDINAVLTAYKMGDAATL